MEMAGGDSDAWEDGSLQGPLVTLVALVTLGVAVPWYFSFSEVIVAEALLYVRIAMALLPILLLLVVKLQAESDLFEAAVSGAWSFMSSALEPEGPRDEAGGGGEGASPVTVALFLAIVSLMIWHQSGLHFWIIPW
ncbi:hypothetical protein KP509_03G036300 [Ceratopteris richardii]|uniref:Uncharacterized protein n=1 Tax=Ceratopteris richardii TaxID=49495 RepID=A0A8T2V685_CERRI|nr:hypothetical protein KP509_03G036300 [Ceratopteris richardii]